MVTGERVISVAEGKEYVWHVKYVSEDTTPRLPLVADDDTIFQLNRRVSGVDGTCLVAVKQVQGADSKTTSQTLWTAWPGVSMNVAIQAGNVIFSGGNEAIFATNAVSGEALWKAPAPGQVTDLAFHGGRLCVVCRSGQVLCFAAAGPR